MLSRQSIGEEPAMKTLFAAVSLLCLAAGTTIAADAAPAAMTPAEKAIYDRAMADFDANLYALSSKTAAARSKDLNSDPTTPVMGNPNGDVTIVEFFDYQCPYCKAVDPRLHALLESDKNIRLISKEFPVLTPESIVATRAALASVKQGKYADYRRVMLAHKGRLTEADIFRIAGEVGLNVETLKADMKDPAVDKYIFDTMNLARSLRIAVVPGFIVNGKVLSGVLSKTETSKIDFPAEVAAGRAKAGS
jgi:protein-disulfide isomerase